MKRALFFALALCLCLTLLAGCGPRQPEPPSEEAPDDVGQITPEVLREEAPAPYFDPREEAVRRYALIFGDRLSFRDGETVAFADVFPYFTYAGVYRPDEAYLYSLPELAACRDVEEWVYRIPVETAEDLISREILTEEDFPEDMREEDVYRIPIDFFTVRREVYPYFDRETWTFSRVPARLVDGFLTETFPTAADHTGIDAYDPATDTYSFAAFTEESHYDISMGSGSGTSEGLWTFAAAAVLDREIQPDPVTGCSYTFSIQLKEGGDCRFLSVQASPLNPWDVYQPSEDQGALATLLAGRTGTAAADEALIRAVFDYQRQTVRRGAEWSLLPAFSEDCPPDWDALALYVYMMCEDTGENAEGYPTMTDKAFDATVEQYLPGISYTPDDSPYFAYADGVHTSRGWGDISGDLLLPVSLTCHGDGTYTMALNGYRFYELEDMNDEASLSPLTKAILALRDGQSPVSRLGALLGLYVDESTRYSLPVSSQVTITFRLTGDEAHPFRYLSCERPELPPQA